MFDHERTPSVTVVTHDGGALAPVVASSFMEYLFELYVAGDGFRSRTAVETLTQMCDERLPGRYDLAVIDVLVEPEKAERAKILATPTLLRRRPTPDVRIIGDLTLTRSVLARLGVPLKVTNETEAP